MLIKIYKMGNKLGLYFPKDKQIYKKYKKGELLLLTIKKNSKKEKLIARFNYNIVIRNHFIKTLKLEKNDIVDINLEKIKNLERTKELFHNNKIDLLSLIPEKTSQDYEIIVYPYEKNNEEWLKLWYLHERGSGNQLEIKRFIDIKKFGSLSGQYQAEGTKPVNSKYPKYRVEFTNKLIQEHKEFLENLLELGINKDDFNARFTYNPLKFSEEKVKEKILKFKEKTGIIPSTTQFKKAKGIGFKLSVNNTILMEIILNSLKIIRNSFVDIKKEEHKILINNFFAKLLTGDGTLHIRKRDVSNFEATIAIGDADESYLKDYKLMMKSLSFNPYFNGKIYVRSYCRLEHLIYLHKIKAFYNTKNWYRLLIAIDLYSKRKNDPYLSKNAKSALIKPMEELDKIKKEKDISNSLDLLNSLKMKPNSVMY